LINLTRHTAAAQGNHIVQVKRR